MLVVNRVITGLVCFAYNSEGSCETSESKVPVKVALAFTAIGWLPQLTWSSQAICSVVVLAGLAASSPARLFKPGYLLF